MLFEKKNYFMPARVKFGSVPKRFGTKFTIYSIMISESRLFSPGIRAGAIYVQYCSGPLPVTRYTLTKIALTIPAKQASIGESFGGFPYSG